MFESRAESECLDFSRALRRYDECLTKNLNIEKTLITTRLNKRNHVHH